MTHPALYETRPLAAALLALSLLAIPAAAQHPNLEHDHDSSNHTLGFELGSPTGGKYAMLVCYFDIVGDQDGLSKLLKKSVGAIGSYVSPNTSTTPFAIPGVSTAVGGQPNAGVPTDEVYTVPPSIIANAIAEIEWGDSANPSPFHGYAQLFQDEMSWNIDQFTAGAKSLPWTSIAVPNQSDKFDVEGLVRACLARQLSYVSRLPVDDVTIKTQVEAIVGTCRADGQNVALNLVAVELQDGGPGVEPAPPRIKLSRNVRITLQIPGAGGNTNRFFHWEYVFPVYPGSTLGAPLTGEPSPGILQVFVPTLFGYEICTATLHSESVGGVGMIYWIEATMPQTVATGPFIGWNATTLEPLQMEGLTSTRTSHYTFFAPHPVTFVSFPLLPY